MVTDERQSRKLGVIGAPSAGTNTFACSRSIAVGERARENVT